MAPLALYFSLSGSLKRTFKESKIAFFFELGESFVNQFLKFVFKSQCWEFESGKDLTQPIGYPHAIK